MIGQLDRSVCQHLDCGLDRHIRQELVKVDGAAGGAEEGGGGVGWVQQEHAHASPTFEVRHICGEIDVA